MRRCSGANAARRGCGLILNSRIAEVACKSCGLGATARTPIKAGVEGFGCDRERRVEELWQAEGPGRLTHARCRCRHQAAIGNARQPSTTPQSGRQLHVAAPPERGARQDKAIARSQVAQRHGEPARARGPGLRHLSLNPRPARLSAASQTRSCAPCVWKSCCPCSGTADGSAGLAPPKPMRCAALHTRELL